jgi:hypothetical protein
MAKIIAVLINWAATKQLGMIALATNVVTLMTKNVGTFATPDVVLSVLTTAAKRLQDAYNARKGDANAKLEYKNAAIALDAMLHTQAGYVNYTAKGNAATILLSGFTATSDASNVKKTKTGAPDAVGTATPGGGLLELSVAKVKNATSYIYVIFLGVVGEIIIGANYVRTTTDSIIVTRGKLNETVSFLTPGTTVTICALTQNAGGISPAGPSTTKLIN